MLNFDSTVNIATILALVAIVCPVLTAIIDNLFRLIFNALKISKKDMSRISYIKGRFLKIFYLLLMKFANAESTKHSLAMPPAIL